MSVHLTIPRMSKERHAIPNLPARALVAAIGSQQDCDLLEHGSMPQEPDLVEFRLDQLKENWSDIHIKKWPSIVTARHPEEGGSSELSAQQRASLLEQAGKQAAFIDIELRSLKENPELFEPLVAAFEGRLILSYHNFEGCESKEDVLEIIFEMIKRGAQIAKLALTPKNDIDLQQLYQIQKESEQPLSLMGMGALGKESRQRLLEAGSSLNYGYLEKATAPGQCSLEELAQWRATLS